VSSRSRSRRDRTDLSPCSRDWSGKLLIGSLPSSLLCPLRRISDPLLSRLLALSSASRNRPPATPSLAAEPANPTHLPSPGTRGKPIKRDLVISGNLLQPYQTLHTSSGSVLDQTRLAPLPIDTTLPAGETFTLYTGRASVRADEFLDRGEVTVLSGIVAPTELSTLEGLPSQTALPGRSTCEFEAACRWITQREN